MFLKDLPWEVGRDLFFKFKKYVFSRDKFNTNMWLPGMRLKELKRILREEGFINGEYFSYEYKGEDLNVVKPIYVDDDIKWYQVHVRVKEVWNHSEVKPWCHVDVHTEVDPREDGLSKPHLKGVNMNKVDPTDYMEDIFEDRDIEYR